MATELRSKRCKPCRPGTPALAAEKVKKLLGSLKGWHSDGKEISRTFNFKNYHETMAFVNALAFISHREDHHPDLLVGYNKCVVKYSTHSVGGLSENDFICAAKVDALMEA
jgi:4a-hydroxytetrahydrobiopterin dehydratase